VKTSGLRRLLVLALVAAALLLAGLYGTYRLARSPSTQLLGRLVSRVATPERMVALSFDDGPTAGFADEVLAVLGSRQVRATFFVNGDPLALQSHEVSDAVPTHEGGGA